MSLNRRRFLKNTALAGGGALLGTAALDQLAPWIWREPLPIDRNHSYWARSQPPQNEKLTQDLKVDVAIVGGGLTGLSAAYFIRLISPQSSVAVLEARGCGNGASGRNGAMLLTMTADRFMSFSADPAMDKQIYDLTVDNIRRLTKLSTATGIDFELETHGALQVFSSSDDAKAADQTDQVRSVANVRVMEIGYCEAREQTQKKHNDAVTGQAQIDGHLHESVLPCLRSLKLR